MPLTAPGPSKHQPASTITDPGIVREFQQKAILYSIGAVAGAVLWFVFRESVPFQVAAPAVGAAAIEAARNIKRWIEWSQAQPGGGRLHPDRVREMQQESVRVLSEAARARAWFTRGIIACITVPSAVELFVGVEHAVAVASVDPGPIHAGETWRLLGGTYLHGSLYHYLGNMSALLIYGSILESKDSRYRLPLVYLLSALGGSVASVMLPPDVPSVGASGGVVGVIAYLFLLSRRQDVKFPAMFRGATASVFVGLITAGALGFWYIDNPGHAGGAIAGLVLAALMVDPARNFGDEISTPLLDMLGWIATAILVAGAAITTIYLTDRSIDLF